MLTPHWCRPSRTENTCSAYLPATGYVGDDTGGDACADGVELKSATDTTWSDRVQRQRVYNVNAPTTSTHPLIFYLQPF